MSDTSWHSNVQYGTGGKASGRAEARVIFILIRKNAYWYERMSNGNMKEPEARQAGERRQG
jgi:hypothetical protein